MTTLCQITAVSDEKEFFDRLKEYGHAHRLTGGGWGRFTGEVPEINTSFTIWHPESEERQPDVFRVIYHHRAFNSERMSADEETDTRHLEVGCNTLEICYVFVVKLSIQII